MHLHEYSCKSCENKRGCLCTSERGKRIKLNIINLTKKNDNFLNK